MVADNLRERILQGEYIPGDFLPSVDELQTEFEVSRPTMREALNLLEGSGYVRLRRGPGGGSEVCAPDNGEVVRALDALLRFEKTTPAHLMEVRLVLEPVAARLAAERATDDQLTRLAEVIERQRQPEVLDDLRRWMEEKLEFHRQIAEMSCNPVIRVLTNSLHELELQAALDAAYTVEYRLKGIKQQAEIVARLQARDPKGAEAAFRRHLSQSVWS